MNREIKFRALRVDGKGMVYGSFIHNKIDCHCIIDEDANQYEVIPETVGQFTGLKDKNGVDIYEGDIVQFSTRRYHLGTDKGLQTIKFRSCVVYEEGCFLISESSENDTYLYAHDNLQIIGNIHEKEVPSE